MWFDNRTELQCSKSDLTYSIHEHDHLDGVLVIGPTTLYILHVDFALHLRAIADKKANLLIAMFVKHLNINT